ncbi:MAG TPA: acyltransferase [Edaphobacter sp.]
MSSPTKEAVDFPGTTASLLLDLARGVAAILVLLAHWKIMFFVDYPKIPSSRALFAIPYVICSAGRQSVLIFFVLSGYLISGSIFRSFQRGNWRWSSYLVHRLVRLWVVLIPGLVIGALWDWIGLHHLHTPSLYHGISPKSHLVDVSRTLSPSAFIGNVAFLQTLFFPTLGSNRALWSLANEFWYYILFPLGWLSLRPGRPTSHRIIYSALFLGLAWFLRSTILPLFPIWLAGSALALLPALRCGNVARIAATSVYTPLVFLFAKTNFLPGLAQDYLFGALTFLFFWIMLSARQRCGTGWHVSLVRQTARCSYTIYIVHMPLLLLLTAFVAGDTLWSPANLPRTFIALAVLVVILAYSFLMAACTEFHTDRIRSWVERRLDLTSKIPSLQKEDKLVGAGR